MIVQVRPSENSLPFSILTPTSIENLTQMIWLLSLWNHTSLHQSLQKIIGTDNPQDFADLQEYILHCADSQLGKIQLLIHDPPVEDPGANVNVDSFCGVT
jgi:hypothetical protein